MSQNPFGHPTTCVCRSCEEWREDQLDLAAASQAVDLLAKMKANKACFAQEQTRWKCEFCGNTHPGTLEKCPDCGGTRNDSSPSPMSPEDSPKFTVIQTSGPRVIITSGSQGPNVVQTSGARKTCMRCHANIDIHAKFCPYCALPQATSPQTCHGCGKSIDGNARFCPHCGVKQ